MNKEERRSIEQSSRSLVSDREAIVKERKRAAQKVPLRVVQSNFLVAKGLLMTQSELP